LCVLTMDDISECAVLLKRYKIFARAKKFVLLIIFVSKKKQTLTSAIYSTTCASGNQRDRVKKSIVLF